MRPPPGKQNRRRSASVYADSAGIYGGVAGVFAGLGAVYGGRASKQRRVRDGDAALVSSGRSAVSARDAERLLSGCVDLPLI
eukprot:1942903-Rhodomonas_salina.2